MKKKRTKKEITNREMWLGILIAIFGAVVDFCFFGFSYSADPQGEHGEITTASIVLSVIWIALSLAGAFLMSYFLNDRSFLFGFSGYLILSLVVVYPLLYGYCASLYPAYADSRKAIPQQDHARKYARFVSDIRAAALIACLYFIFSRTASCQKARRLNIKNPAVLHENRTAGFFILSLIICRTAGAGNRRQQPSR